MIPSEAVSTSFKGGAFQLSELRYAAAVLRDMKESTKDGAFVQVGAYWYEVQDLTKSIEAIKEAIEEAENEEAG